MQTSLCFLNLCIYASFLYALAIDPGIKVMNLQDRAMTKRALISSFIPPRAIQRLEERLEEVVKWSEWAQETLVFSENTRIGAEGHIAHTVLDRNNVVIRDRMQRRFSAVILEARQPAEGWMAPHRSRIMISPYNRFDNRCQQGETYAWTRENEIYLVLIRILRILFW